MSWISWKLLPSRAANYETMSPSEKTRVLALIWTSKPLWNGHLEPTFLRYEKSNKRATFRHKTASSGLRKLASNCYSVLGSNAIWKRTLPLQRLSLKLPLIATLIIDHGIQWLYSFTGQLVIQGDSHVTIVIVYFFWNYHDLSLWDLSLRKCLKLDRIKKTRHNASGTFFASFLSAVRESPEVKCLSRSRNETIITQVAAMKLKQHR